MSTDHKALAVIAAVAVMGVGVRLTRDPASADALVGASAANAAGRSAGSKKSPAAGASDDQKPKKGKRTTKKTAASTPGSTQPTAGTPTLPTGSDQAGYIGGRLDMDIATLAQIESLPGIGPTLGARIVLDRKAHGPFLNKEGLQRVRGIGPVMLQRLDSLITFSGRLTPLPDSAAASLKPDGLTSKSDSSRSRAGTSKKRAKKPNIS